MNLGYILSMPLIFELILQRGVMHTVRTLIWLVMTGAPVFFLFQAVTKAFYFMQSLFVSAATYRATGRGISMQHTPFLELYQAFAASHCYLGLEILCTLLVLHIVSDTSLEAGLAYTTGGGVSLISAN